MIENNEETRREKRRRRRKYRQTNITEIKDMKNEMEIAYPDYEIKLENEALVIKPCGNGDFSPGRNTIDNITVNFDEPRPRTQSLDEANSWDHVRAKTPELGGRNRFSTDSIKNLSPCITGGISNNKRGKSGFEIEEKVKPFESFIEEKKKEEANKQVYELNKKIDHVLNKARMKMKETEEFVKDTNQFIEVNHPDNRVNVLDSIELPERVILQSNNLQCSSMLLGNELERPDGQDEAQQFFDQSDEMALQNQKIGFEEEEDSDQMVSFEQSNDLLFSSQQTNQQVSGIGMSDPCLSNLDLGYLPPVNEEDEILQESEVIMEHNRSNIRKEYEEEPDSERDYNKRVYFPEAKPLPPLESRIEEEAEDIYSGYNSMNFSKGVLHESTLMNKGSNLLESQFENLENGGNGGLLESSLIGQDEGTVDQPDGFAETEPDNNEAQLETIKSEDENEYNSNYTQSDQSDGKASAIVEEKYEKRILESFPEAKWSKYDSKDKPLPKRVEDLLQTSINHLSDSSLNLSKNRSNLISNPDSNSRDMVKDSFDNDKGSILGALKGKSDSELYDSIDQGINSKDSKARSISGNLTFNLTSY